ncbi:MAG: hypothetical protein AB1921_11395, partial [Thermodesulfobacteriota bacterium]
DSFSNIDWQKTSLQNNQFLQRVRRILCSYPHPKLVGVPLQSPKVLRKGGGGGAGKGEKPLFSKGVSPLPREILFFFSFKIASPSFF